MMNAPLNPIKWNTIPEILGGLGGLFMVFAFPVGVLIILYASFLYMTAGDSAQKVTQAHKAIAWAVVGLTLVIIGSGITSTICQILGVTGGVC